MTKCLCRTEALTALMSQLCESYHFQPLQASFGQCFFSMFELLKALVSQLCESCMFQLLQASLDQSCGAPALWKLAMLAKRSFCPAEADVVHGHLPSGPSPV